MYDDWQTKISLLANVSKLQLSQSLLSLSKLSLYSVHVEYKLPVAFKIHSPQL